MDGKMQSNDSSAEQEKMGLLDDRSISSDAETDSALDELEIRFNVRRWTNPLKHLVNNMESTQWRYLLSRFFMFLVPSFLQGRHARENIRPSKLSPTAYLDGMRGLAALFVYFCHYSYQAFIIAKGWGRDEVNMHVFKLPILRLWYQGPPAVSVFFVISGYALSYRALKLARSGDFAAFGNNMGSLVFRRGIRLYLPTAISTLLVVFLLQFGAYELTRDFATDRTYMKNIVEPHPMPLPTMYLQLKDWASQMFKFLHVFSWDEYGGQPQLDVHLWTIPLEFRCSLYLFLVTIATARLRTCYRFLTVITVGYVTYLKCRWELVLFFCGMLIAEMDLIRGAHTPSSVLPLDEKHQASKRGGSCKPIWAIMSLVALYLMSQPDDGGEVTPGWVYLSSLIPDWWSVEKYRYWQSVGAVMFVIAVSRSGFWQKFFNSGPLQYLGKISYALYLMHGPAMHCIGYHWERWAYSVTGVEGWWYNAGFFLGASLCLPTVIWWADVFWRAVDVPTVKFAKWFEAKLSKD